MRIFRRLVLLLLGLLAVAIIAFAWRAADLRALDERYHAQLAKTILLTSRSFAANGNIPSTLTCQAGHPTPELEWTQEPDNTLSYALLVIDPDAPSPMIRLSLFDHWVLYDIPAQQSSIAAALDSAALSGAGIRVGKNTAGERAYEAPCPPLGEHRYIYRLYALDVPQLHPPTDDRSGLMKAMQGHILAYGELIARFAQTRP